MAKKTKIQELRMALRSNFYEREEIVDGMLTALLAEENVFLLGPPGTGKSALCEALCKSLSGNYFSYLIGKFTTPDELFGPPSFRAIQEDKFERNTTGKLPEADVAFLDEIFKGNSAILNSLLTILNERKFYNNGVKNIPLKIVLGASNEVPQGEELAALDDRFTVRYIVDRIQKDANAKDFFSKAADGSLASAPIPHLSEAELNDAKAAAQAVKLTDAGIEILCKLRNEMTANGFAISDRKWRKAVNLLKAYAHLNGRTEIEEEDYEILNDVLWSNPDDRKAIRSVVRAVCNPIGAKIIEEVDAAYALIGEVSRKVDSGQISGKNIAEAHDQLKKSAERLRKLADKNPSKAERINRAITSLEELNKTKIVSKLFEL